MEGVVTQATRRPPGAPPDRRPEGLASTSMSQGTVARKNTLPTGFEHLIYRRATAVPARENVKVCQGSGPIPLFLP